MGPQNKGDNAITIIYAALLRFIMLPVLLKVFATSGVAANTEVLDIGDRNAPNDRTATIATLRLEETLSKISSPASR
jgi:hypothetical protein